MEIYQPPIIKKTSRHPSPEPTQAAKERPLGESYIAARLKDRILRRNLNALVGFFGPPGSGKSYSGERLAELVDPTFNVDRIVFDVKSLIRIINWGLPGPKGENVPLNRGEFLMLDDAGVAANSRKWWSDTNMILSYVGQSFRFMGFGVIVTAPDTADLDAQFRQLFHVTFQTQMKDDSEKIVYTKPEIPRRDTIRGKTYHPFPRVRIPNFPKIKYRLIGFRLPSQALRDAYEPKRAAFMSGLYKDLEQNLGIRSNRIPLWAEKLLLKSAQGRKQGELALELGISREHLNTVLSRAKKERPG
jgi:hypothetical protein